MAVRKLEDNILQGLFDDEIYALECAKNTLGDYKNCLPQLKPALNRLRSETRDLVFRSMIAVSEDAVMERNGDVVLVDGLESAFDTLENCGQPRNFKVEIYDDIYEYIILDDNPWSERAEVDFSSWYPVMANKIDVISKLIGIYDEFLEDTLIFCGKRISMTHFFHTYTKRVFEKIDNTYGPRTSAKNLKNFLYHKRDGAGPRIDYINPSIKDAIFEVLNNY